MRLYSFTNQCILVFLLQIGLTSLQSQGPASIEYVKLIEFNSEKSLDPVLVNDNLKKILKRDISLIQTELMDRDRNPIAVRLELKQFSQVGQGNSKYYSGTIIDQPTSLVTLKVKKGIIEAMISDRFGNYRINAAGDGISFGDDQFINKQWECASSTQSFADQKNFAQKDQRRLKSFEGDTISVYFECDFEMYQSFGSSVNATVEYVNDLFHQVSTIYQNEGITIVIEDIYVWQSPDPYSKSSVQAALISFKDNVGPFNATFAHLLSTYNNLNGGIALINGICNDNNAFAYSNLDGDLGQQGVYSWDVHVVTHELGHNLGSPHTHDCAWGPNGDEAIDACGGPPPSCDNAPIPPQGGTIMSYCHQTAVGVNFSLGFGAEPGDLIRSTIENCLPDEGENCALATEIFGSTTIQIADITTGSGAFHSDAVHARWFYFIPPENGTIDISSCNEGIDTRLYLYTGECIDLGLIGSSDDDCLSGNGYFYASTLENINVLAGETYFIEWDDKWSQEGFAFAFTFTSDLSTCSNGVMDGNETGIDCGGICEPCMEPCSDTSIPMVVDTLIAHRSMDTIKYSGRVDENGDLQVYSSLEIVLEPGFEISNNGLFEVNINDCIQN